MSLLLKLYYAIVLFWVVCHLVWLSRVNFAEPTFGTGTVIATIVTSDAIVVAADNKNTVRPTHQGYKTTLPPVEQKIFLFQKHIIVGSTGFASFRNDGKDVYNFSTFIADIEKRFSDNATVQQVSNAILEESGRGFSDFGVMMKNGIITKEEFTGPSLLHYFVIGYDQRTPTAYLIWFDFDWGNNRLIGPQIKSYNPPAGYTMSIGSTIVLNEIHNRSGPYFEKFLAAIPAEACTLIEQDQVTTPQASTILRTIVNLSAEAHPDVIGPPITVITVHKDGPADIQTNEK